jgi:hypothetical protein
VWYNFRTNQSGNFRTNQSGAQSAALVVHIRIQRARRVSGTRLRSSTPRRARPMQGGVPPVYGMLRPGPYGGFPQQGYGHGQFNQFINGCPVVRGAPKRPRRWRSPSTRPPSAQRMKRARSAEAVNKRSAARYPPAPGNARQPQPA